jgi:hypothetical protein
VNASATRSLGIVAPMGIAACGSGSWGDSSANNGADSDTTQADTTTSNWDATVRRAFSLTAT